MTITVDHNRDLFIADPSGRAEFCTNARQMREAVIEAGALSCSHEATGANRRPDRCRVRMQHWALDYIRDPLA